MSHTVGSIYCMNLAVAMLEFRKYLFSWMVFHKYNHREGK